MEESIGAKLRQARELRRLTLQQVSESTKVRPHYLQALENDDLSAIPSAAQARGFLGIYAGFLRLDLSELVPAVQPAQPASPAGASSGSPAIEMPNPQAAPRFGIRAWAGERWSQLAGRVSRAGTASEPSSPAPSEEAESGLSAQGEASEPGPLTRSEASEPDSSTHSEASKTDPGASISFAPTAGNEQLDEPSKIPSPLKSRIRQMFLDTTVERASASPEAADQTPPQPDRGPRRADLGAGLLADTKKKAGS